MTKLALTITAALIVCQWAAIGRAADAQAIESDWLQPSTGYEESKIGARVESITELPGDMQKLYISLPAATQPIEEVIVVGKRQNRFHSIPQQKPFEIVNDLKSGRHGIVIYLGKLQNFALRINYEDGYRYLPGVE